jgi:hypothetical protein
VSLFHPDIFLGKEGGGKKLFSFCKTKNSEHTAVFFRVIVEGFRVVDKDGDTPKQRFYFSTCHRNEITV